MTLCLACLLAGEGWATEDMRIAEGSNTGGDGAAVTLRSDEDGAVLPDVLIEGEDRIRVDFDRPKLELNLDPQQVPGLKMGGLQEAMDRATLDLTSPMLAETALMRTPYLAHPWLDCFSSPPLARFHPDLDGVDQWKLLIVDSRGEKVKEFSGRGTPPEEIEWDGLSGGGSPAVPGLTYSYVLEAYDRAGNKRNFVGEGFRLPPYRLETADSLFMLFPGSEIPIDRRSSNHTSEGPPAVILEAASRINQIPGSENAINIRARAGSFEAARQLGTGVAEGLAPLLLGNPTRVRVVTEVDPAAPEPGTVIIAAAR